jgi:methylenetetrahydrofolate reductase (NADPH)
VLQAISRPRPSLSFEIFPPKTASGEAALRRQGDALARLSPDFVSVTYGASGAAGDRLRLSCRMCAWVKRDVAVPPLAHLTITGHTVAELRAAIGRFKELGVTTLLALRGDPPAGGDGVWRPRADGLDHAVGLVALAREAGLDVGVAAFPYGHPEARDLAQDTAALLAKERVGASFAVTQMFFDPLAYGRLVERVRAAGVTIPIVPGIMPVTSVGQRPKLEGFAGAPLPAALAGALEGAETDEAVEAVGIDWACSEVAALLDAGAPGIHFYTLNKSRAALEVCRRAELRPDA